MENWKVVTALVTVFAFSLEFRPMDSFLTAYLTGPQIHVTLAEVYYVIIVLRFGFVKYLSEIIRIFFFFFLDGISNTSNCFPTNTLF